MGAGPLIRIGSRGSPLALAQTGEARRALLESLDAGPEAVVVETIRTTGDRILDRSLADAGGKGLFTKELDSALLEGRIDCAVHSAKDLPTFLPPGLAIALYRPRADARDAFISRSARSFSELPKGASFGTASPRRTAQALRLRPDLRIALLRGNVETRLSRVESGDVDATVLAAAGLARLGLEGRAAALLSIEEFLPAAAQGAVAVTVREDDAGARALLAPLADRDTERAVSAERAFLAVLEGSCRTPLACHGVIAEGTLALRAMAFEADGSKFWETEKNGPAEEAEEVGRRAAEDILTRLPKGFFKR